MKQKSPMNRLMVLVWKNWQLYFASVFSTITYLIMEMVTRTLMGQTMDAATNMDTDFWSHLIWLIAIPLLAAPFHTIATMTKYRLGAKVLMMLRIIVGEKASVLSIPALEEQKSGDIMSHLGAELKSINSFVGYGLSMITTLAVQIIGTTIFMTVIDWQMTILFMITSLLVLPISLVISRPLKDLEVTLREENGKAQQIANEGLHSLITVKSFQLENWMDRRFYTAVRNVMAIDLHMQRMTLGMTAAGKLLGYLPMMVMLAAGAMRLMEGTLTPGMLLSLTTVSSGFISWLTGVPHVFGYIQRCRGACIRVFGYLDLPEEKGGSVQEAKTGAPMVSFQNVSFSYHNGKMILSDLSFTVKQGEKVALVGASGSGKSTILRLICGFLHTHEGCVELRGNQIEDWVLKALRKQLSYVTQDSYLFPGSIRENLLVAKKDATDEELRTVCKRAGILDFVDERGLDSPVGERGTQLSGGERQRISIARAMLKNAPLLLLDEPTSALDAEAERVVQESLERLMEGKTTIVVAHRLSTIRNADRILLLSEGKITAEGTHEELIVKSKMYRDMVEKQLLEVRKDEIEE